MTGWVTVVPYLPLQSMRGWSEGVEGGEGSLSPTSVLCVENGVLVLLVCDNHPGARSREVDLLMC